MSIWGTSERRFTLNNTILKTWNLPRSIPRNFFKSLILKADSKRFQRVKIYPSMSLRNNLENTEFFTEFLIIFSNVPFTLCTPQLIFQMAVASFYMNLRNIRVTLYKKWHNLANTESCGEHSAEDSVFSRLCHFRLSVAPMFLKFTQNNALAIWNIKCGLESVNGTFEQILWNSVKIPCFSRLCHISLITYSKDI